MAPLQDGCASMASRVSSPDAKRAQWVAARSTSVGLVDESCASSCCLPAHAKGAVRREQQKYTPIRTGTRWVCGWNIRVSTEYRQACMATEQQSTDLAQGFPTSWWCVFDKQHVAHVDLPGRVGRSHGPRIQTQ
eukprot:1179960-Prorocentrum_minimum.AAC.4